RMSSLATRGMVGRALGGGPGEKSLIAAGALGIIGPLGWVYSAPLGEAIPAFLVWLVAWKLLWLIPILGPMVASLLVPASVLLGMAYAWQHNRHGKATSLFSGDDDHPRLPGKR